MLRHPWLANEPLVNPVGDKALREVSFNIQQYIMASNFQKMVLSIMTGLKVQQ